MRRALFLVAVVCLITSAVFAQSAEPISAMYVATVYVASPMRTQEEAVSAAGHQASVIATNDTDTPYLVVSGTDLIVCVRAGALDEVKSAADAHARYLNRGRAYVVEAFADRFTAQFLLERLQGTTYSFFSDAWVAERRNGGAFVVYRNPAL